jgi:hypothetical protein
MGWKLPNVLGRLDDLVDGVFGDIGHGTTARTWSFPPGPKCRTPAVPPTPSPAVASSVTAATSPPPPLTASTPPPASAKAPARSQWTLGQLSEKYESGGRGPATVSSGQGDPGGVSYGTYQLSSKPAGGTATRFVIDAQFPWKGRFTNLHAGSPQFTAAWRKLAHEQRAGLAAMEREFIKRTHYDILVSNIRQDTGLDVDSRSNALRDVVWSTAVQHGPNTRVVDRAVSTLQKASPALTANSPGYERQLIIAIYAERGRRNPDGTLVYFSKSSAAVQRSIVKRFEQELRDALRELAPDGGAPSTSASSAAPAAAPLP